MQFNILLKKKTEEFTKPSSKRNRFDKNGKYVVISTMCSGKLGFYIYKICRTNLFCKRVAQKFFTHIKCLWFLVFNNTVKLSAFNHIINSVCC